MRRKIDINRNSNNEPKDHPQSIPAAQSAPIVPPVAVDDGGAPIAAAAAPGIGAPAAPVIPAPAAPAIPAPIAPAAPVIPAPAAPVIPAPAAPVVGGIRANPNSLQDKDALLSNLNIHNPNQQKKFTKEELALVKTAEAYVSRLATTKNTAEYKEIDEALGLDREKIQLFLARGQLTLTAQHTSHDFLFYIEKMILNHPNLEFTLGIEPQNLKSLYENERQRLMIQNPQMEEEKGKELTVSAILISMYTQSSDYYRIINKAATHYQADQIPDFQYKLAFVLLLATHKAALNQVQLNYTVAQHLTLFRGQTHGRADMIEKYRNFLNKKNQQTDFSQITPYNIHNMNCRALFDKQILSVSSSAAIAQQFSNDYGQGTGFIAKILNPEFFDFCSIEELSAIAQEKEWLTRLPDDIAIIPVDYQADLQMFTVVLLRHEAYAQNNSTRLDEVKEDLIASIEFAQASKMTTYKKGEEKITFVFANNQRGDLQVLKDTINQKHPRILQINAQNGDEKEEQIDLMTHAILCFQNIHKDEKQVKKELLGEYKKLLKKVENKYGNYCAVISDLRVCHRFDKLVTNPPVTDAGYLIRKSIEANPQFIENYIPIANNPYLVFAQNNNNNGAPLQGNVDDHGQQNQLGNH